MHNDMPLFNIPITRAKHFEHYDQLNPHIWREFERIALNLIAQGVRHYGSKAIFEVIRYETAIAAKSDIFKLNNNFTAGYARKFQRKYPQYSNFFEMRKASREGNHANN